MIDMTQEQKRELVEALCKAIAEGGMCRPWPDDFASVDAFSTDQNDVRAYAQACVPVVLSAIRAAEERGRLAERERCARIAGSMRRPIDALYSDVDQCNAYNAGVNAAEDAIRGDGDTGRGME